MAVVERCKQESMYGFFSGTTKSGCCRDLEVGVCEGSTVTLNDAFWMKPAMSQIQLRWCLIDLF